MFSFVSYVAERNSNITVAEMELNEPGIELLQERTTWDWLLRLAGSPFNRMLPFQYSQAFSADKKKKRFYLSAHHVWFVGCDFLISVQSVEKRCRKRHFCLRRGETHQQALLCLAEEMDYLLLVLTKGHLKRYSASIWAGQVTLSSFSNPSIPVFSLISIPVQIIFLSIDHAVFSCPYVSLLHRHDEASESHGLYRQAG